MYIQSIQSLKNKKIKQLLSLRDRSQRDAFGVFGVEGAREIRQACNASFKLRELFICPDLLSVEAKDVLDTLQSIANKPLIYEISKLVFSKIVVRDHSDGLFAVFEKKLFSFDDFSDNKNQFYLILDGIEKPGNIGALFRTLDGINAAGVVIHDNVVDPFNPNCIRSSLGTIFTIPIVFASGEDTLAYFSAKRIPVLAATLDSNCSHYEIDYSNGFGLVLGSEAHGISKFWLQKASYKIKIPMLGMSDSLNVSVAGAVICYEALRQRLSFGRSL